MKTREEAEAKLQRCALLAPVAVADVGAARRSYTFTDSSGGTTIVEIDADPSERQLQDLAANLPVQEKDRDATLATLRGEASTTTKAIAVGAAVIAAAAAAYEIADQLGLLN